MISPTPKVRLVEMKPFMNGADPMLALIDPWQLSDHYLSLPQGLGWVLYLFDGTRSLADVQREVRATSGMELSTTDLQYLLENLDNLYLLENERMHQARRAAISAFRRETHRSPSSAGFSYAAEPAALRRELQQFVDQSMPIDSLAEGAGLISPHIDYARGGKVYARAWQHIARPAREAEVVVVFGTDHNSVLPAQITPTRQNYATPFGVLPTDQKVVDALVDVLGEDSAFAEELHHRREWSIELVVTWLHFIRQGKSVPIVPILCGSFYHFWRNGHAPADDAVMGQVIDAIRQTTAGRRVLVVASGDLAHLGPAFDTDPIGLEDWAKLKVDDDHMLTPLQAGDPDAFFEIIRSEQGRRNVCGTSPFYLSLKLMGEVQGLLTSYDRCVADAQDTSYVSVCGMTFA